MWKRPHQPQPSYLIFCRVTWLNQLVSMAINDDGRFRVAHPGNVQLLLVDDRHHCRRPTVVLLQEIMGNLAELFPNIIHIHFEIQDLGKQTREECFPNWRTSSVLMAKACATWKRRLAKFS